MKATGLTLRNTSLSLSQTSPASCFRAFQSLLYEIPARSSCPWSTSCLMFDRPVSRNLRCPGTACSSFGSCFALLDASSLPLAPPTAAPCTRLVPTPDVPSPLFAS